ncbi:MAG: outer membrane protein transport protein [Gammaproteobacteria bacterium]|jgi:long-chain fatty acid transport protein
MVALAVVSPGVTAHAGGLYLYEIGTRDAGLASAGWAARAADAGTIATNPAGLARLKQPQLVVGAQPLYLDLEFDPDENTSVSGSDGDPADWIPSGGLFYARPVNDKWAWGLGVYGNFGLGLDYGTGWVGRYYVDEVTLQALAFQPTMSYRISDHWSVGAGIVGLYAVFDQRARVRNLTPGETDGRLKINDEQFEVTGNFGVLYEPTSATRLGLQYLMETKLEFEDNPRFTGIGPILSQVLEQTGLVGAELGLDLTYPNRLILSGYHELNDRWALMGNVGWDQWSEFGKVDVLVAAEDETTLTFDRNYDDTWHAAAGAEYQASDRWRFSGGVAYDSSPVKDRYRTPDLPVGEAWRFGVGAEYRLREGLTVSGTYALVWSGDLDMDVDRGPLAGRVSGTYTDTAIHAFGLVFNWQYGGR